MNILKLLTFWKKPRRSYSSNLEEKYGLSIKLTVEIVKTSLVNKSKLFLDGQYAYLNLGGSNNYGFITFTSKSKQNTCITKIAPEILLRREALFFKYHENNLDQESSFSPKFISYNTYNNTDLEFLTLEKLEERKTLTPEQVYELYLKSRRGGELFDLGLLQEAPRLNPGTRIKDILFFLVCDFESEKAKTYMDKFFIERIKALPDYANELLFIQSVIRKNYQLLRCVDKSLIGFVHGDFKGSNMMQDQNKSLKLIDFQYYCQGIKVWDLAFYFSKSKLSFSKGIGKILNNFSTENEKRYLVFLYVFAVLLHPKSSVFERDKYKPALEYLGS